MAINMMCMNSECKYYWEDCCTRNLEEKRIEIDGNGKCETFQKGRSNYYEQSEVEEYWLIYRDDLGERKTKTFASVEAAKYWIEKNYAYQLVTIAKTLED